MINKTRRPNTDERRRSSSFLLYPYASLGPDGASGTGQPSTRDRDRSRQGGQSGMELALVLPFLLLIVFGLVDLGRALGAAHQLSRVTREGGNAMTRGTAVRELDRLLAELARSAAPTMDLEAKGRIIISVLEGRAGGAHVIEQQTRGRLPAPSRAGERGERLDGARLAALLYGERLGEGQRVALVEGYYGLDAITPLVAMFGALDAERLVLGSQAVFFFS